jgi:hypothetical protein
MNGRVLARSGLSLAVLCVGIVSAEIGFRVIDGYRLDRWQLLLKSPRIDNGRELESEDYARTRTFEPAFDSAWYRSDPAEYDRAPKRALPADWLRAVENYTPALGEPIFLADELRYLYNRNWLVEACQTGKHSNFIKYYQKNPGFVYAFDGPDASTERIRVSCTRSTDPMRPPSRRSV